MSQRKILPRDIRFLEEVAAAGLQPSSIRLREGEYQHNLVRAIASFQLDLMFPDVKDLIRKLYGEEKTLDVQFVRKIQTILKKMEKSNVVKILPKRNPWQLQRYALSSFKFEDIDRNIVVFATDQQIKEMQDNLHSALMQRERKGREYLKPLGSAVILTASYIAVLWSLLQVVVNPLVFILALSASVVFSLLLGKTLAESVFEQRIKV